MFRTRSADRLSCERHRAARNRQFPLPSGVRAGSFDGFILHLQPSIERASNAQLIHLKQAAATARSPWSLSAAQRMNVNRQRLDRGRVEPIDPCWHNAGTAVANRLDQGRLDGTIKADLVGEI